MTIEVYFSDGTVLVEPMDGDKIAALRRAFPIRYAFENEPGFINVGIRLKPFEAGAVPKMRHYIGRRQ